LHSFDHVHSRRAGNRSSSQGSSCHLAVVVKVADQNVRFCGASRGIRSATALTETKNSSPIRIYASYII
jgi:hypothetical protein